MESKLVGFIGGPGSGKTTLACALKEYFMIKKISTDVCTEYAREFVFEYGFPETPFAQYKLALKQKKREDLLCQGTNKYVFSDSPIWLAYVYGLLLIRSDGTIQDRAVASDIYKEFVVKQINRYDRVFYIQNETPHDDGCKRDKDTEKTIRNLIEGFVKLHEHILPITRMNIPIEETESRKEFVYNELER